MRSLLIALFFAAGALAQSRPAHVHPFGPTSTTPVEIHFPYFCPGREHTIARVGNVIKIHMLDPRCSIVVAVDRTEVVKVPELLPPGHYRIEVTLGDADAVYAAGEFIVRNGAPKPFEIHPFAVPERGALRMRISGVACTRPDCSDVAVRVGDTAVAPLQRARDGAIWFTAPPHAPGLVDVSVQISDFVMLSPAALYYFGGPERSVFEPVLFPVLFSTGGAGGSRWVSEASLLNPRPWFVENWNTLQRVMTCFVPPCGERIAPGQFETYADGFPRGAVLYVPRPEAPDLAFGLRVRDISRRAEGLGTQIPVVREADMLHGQTAALLDVPLDPRYRVKVRVYAVDPVLMSAPAGRIVVRGAGTPRLFPFTMTRNNVHEPFYAERDLPAGAAGERVNVYVQGPLDATLWAFATVTNNETQQVTIVTPNGKGGAPCEDCGVP